MATIQNEYLKLEVSELGAEMVRLQSCSGTDYLWSGDDCYWDWHAPVLFPFVGRLAENRYLLDGKTYPMALHGFAYTACFSCVEKSRDSIKFRLTDSPDTKRSYPFSFEFLVEYALQGWCVEVTYTVENRGPAVLPFAVGGHPGFRVPLEDGRRFEEYSLVFGQRCQPERVGFAPSILPNGTDRAYPLENGRILRLRHDLFDEDAVVLRHTAKSVTLSTEHTSRAITVRYPEMPYLAVWHCPGTDAPFVCIEPWSALPGRDGVVEDFLCKSDLERLPSGGVYRNCWEIEIQEAEDLR